jgi:PAS domain S-box-containing protein
MKTKPSSPATTAETDNGAPAELRDFAAAKEQRPMMADLYSRAAAKLSAQRRNKKTPAKLSESAADPKRLLHELQVHQIELELQNEELRKARDEMESGLEKYSDLYDFAPVGYLTLDRDGAITEANLTGASLLGVARAALVKWRFGAFVSPVDRAAFTVFLQQVFKSKAREECDLRLLLKGTNSVDVRLRAIASNSGQSCRVAVADITEHKRAEDKVRVSEIRYRRLFEAAHDGVLLLDPATRKITDANPFMTRLLGYPHAKLVGKELFEIGLLKDEAASQEMFRKLKVDRQIRCEDLPLESKTGRHQEVEMVANLYQENGRAVIHCNIRDITARKAAADVLRRSEALFSALIGQAPVGVYVVDARFKMQQVNRTAEPAFKKIHPLVGRDFSEVVHLIWPKRVADQIEKRFRHTLKTGEPYQSPEFTARRADLGKKEIYEWQLQRVTLPAGEHGVVWFFNNITERKRAEETQRRVEVLAASNRKLHGEIMRRQAVEESLRKSEQEQSRMLEQSRLLQEQLRQLSRQILTAQEEERREISRELHDVIAQTLTGINVRLAVLRKEAARDPKGLDRGIARTQRQVEKSVDIVHQFARELRPTMLDDLGLIPALHTFMKSFTTRTGVRTRLTAVAAVEKLESSKRTALYRVAQEALTNVARHAKASRVDVSIQKLPGSICMRIKDDGRSFDVERVLRTTGKGRLGLLGMRERLQMVGGCFDVESAPGQGTTILAHVPLGKVAGGAPNPSLKRS